MCLKEVRDTAQAGSLALLPTTPRGGVGWGGVGGASAGGAWAEGSLQWGFWKVGRGCTPFS